MRRKRGLPMSVALKPGSFCWFELTTTDQESAKRFYSDLFGWTPTDNPMGPGAMYTIFRLGDSDTAGAYTQQPEQRAQGVRPSWQVYVLVESADAKAARGAQLGGKVIVPPFDVMDLGRMGVFEDPAGAVIAVWQAGEGGVGAAGGGG